MDQILFGVTWDIISCTILYPCYRLEATFSQDMYNL
jgi:hypothetical protein